MKRYDVAIIGAGVNGLACALRLASKGVKVLVLEQRHVVGGTSSTEELFPGFRVNPCLDHFRWIDRRLARELARDGAGPEIHWAALPVVAMPPAGEPFHLWSDPRRAAESIARFSRKDAERWPEFVRTVAGMAAVLEALNSIAPPPIPNLSFWELPRLAKVAGPAFRLGRRGMVEFMRVLPMSIEEWLDEWFESEPLRATLAAAGISGLRQGPQAIGTALHFLHNHAGRNLAIRPAGIIRGGIGLLAEAIADRIRLKGGEVRIGEGVRQLAIKDGRATAAVLQDGDTVEADQFISAIDPRSTFTRLVEPTHLPPEFNRDVRNIKYRGCMARVHFALSALPRFSATGSASSDHGVLSFSPDVSFLEKAADDAKYGRVSDRLMIEAHISSAADATVAPEGKHLLSASVQFVPRHLRDGEWTNEKRESLIRQVTQQIAESAPGFANLIEATLLLTPADIEARYSLTEGHLGHGELMLDQFFFMRPMAGWARYATPIENLFLCGPGTHPGGVANGASGMNAADAIFRKIQRRRIK